MKGYAPILKATLDDEGRLLDGRVVSAIQLRPDGVRPDPEQRAARLVRDMTALDLSGGGLVFDDAGNFRPARPVPGACAAAAPVTAAGNGLAAAFPALAEALPCICAGGAADAAGGRPGARRDTSASARSR